MQPQPPEHAGHGDQLAVTGPAVEIHGRAVTATRRAAEWYREAQRAADPRHATAALRLAVSADPGFGLAAADLAAITGAPDPDPGRGPMTWERHHIEVVRTVAAGRAGRAVDLLREHLASVGCDPLAFRIVARLRQPVQDDGFEDLAGQLSGCHATRWPGPDPAGRAGLQVLVLGGDRRAEDGRERGPRDLGNCQRGRGWIDLASQDCVTRHDQAQQR